MLVFIETWQGLRKSIELILPAHSLLDRARGPRGGLPTSRIGTSIAAGIRQAPSGQMRC